MSPAVSRYSLYSAEHDGYPIVMREHARETTVPVGYSKPDVPMVKPTHDWQGEHASYPLGVAVGASVFNDRCVRLSL
jgi:hypothetical protein